MDDRGYMPAKLPVRQFRGKSKPKSVPKRTEAKQKERKEEIQKQRGVEERNNIQKVYLESRSIQTEETPKEPRQVQTNIVGTQIPVCMIKIDQPAAEGNKNGKGLPNSSGKLNIRHKQVDIKVHQIVCKLESTRQLPQKLSQFDKKYINTLKLPRVDFSIKKISSGTISRKDKERRCQTQSIEDMRTCKKIQDKYLSKSRNFERRQKDRFGLIPLSQFKKRNLSIKDKIKKAPLEIRCSSEAKDSEQIQEYLYLNINQERLIQTIKRNLDRLEGISCENRRNQKQKF